MISCCKYFLISVKSKVSGSFFVSFAQSAVFGAFFVQRMCNLGKWAKTCVYNRDEMMVLAGFVVRVRVNELVLPEFLSAFMNTDASKQMLLGMCKTAIGQANINAQELQNVAIYIPPIDLQKEFVAFKAQTDKSKFSLKNSRKVSDFAVKYIWESLCRGTLT